MGFVHHGFPDYYFKRPLEDIGLEFNLTPKGEKLFSEGRIEELVIYYRKSAKNLVFKFILDPESITEEEMNRVIYELGKDEMDRIIQGVEKGEINIPENY